MKHIVVTWSLYFCGFHHFRNKINGFSPVWMAASNQRKVLGALFRLRGTYVTLVKFSPQPILCQSAKEPRIIHLSKKLKHSYRDCKIFENCPKMWTHIKVRTKLFDSNLGTIHKLHLQKNIFTTCQFLAMF